MTILHTCRCLSCQRVFFPPRRLCPGCHADNITMQADDVGQLVACTRNPIDGRMLFQVMTRHGAQVLAESDAAPEPGQAVHLALHDKKIVARHHQEP